MKKHRAAQQTRPCVSLDDVNRLAVLPATLPATAVELLIVLAAAAAALPARILVAAALPASRGPPVRDCSGSCFSQILPMQKVHCDSGNCFFECRAAAWADASTQGMKSGLTPVPLRAVHGVLSGTTL